jgi:hypothetical protein
MPVAIILAACFAPGITLAQNHDGQHEHGHAQQSCDTYDVDVTSDIELLTREAVAVTMGPDAAGEIPAVELDRAYEVALHPQSEVAFTVEPGRALPDEGSNAGFMTVSVPASGRYRFSFSAASWVDVVGNGKNLDPVLFAGRHACKPLRKLLDYDLEAGKGYVLMLSGSSARTMLMAVRQIED